MDVSKRLPEAKPERDLDEWDTEIEAEFRRVTRAGSKGGAPKLKKWQRHSTSVPREWELRLRRATRVSTYQLALELLYRQWRADHNEYSRKGEPVTVSGDVVREAGMSRGAVCNALSQLERLGLIEVARAKGRAPRVMLRHATAKAVPS